MAAKASKNLLFNNLKRLNKFAQELRDRRFFQRVIKNKKAYNRKKPEDYSRDS